MRHEKLPFKLLVKRHPKQYRLLLLPLAINKRLKVSPCCWRQHKLLTEDLEDTNWIWQGSFPRVLAFIVPEGNMQATKRKAINTSTQLCYKPHSMVRCSLRLNSGTHTAVVTSSYPVKVCFSQLPGASEATDGREESTTTLLGQCNS